MNFAPLESNPNKSLSPGIIPTEMPETNLAEASSFAVEKLCSLTLVQGVQKLAGSSGGKITFRPVEIKGKRHLQISTFDGRKTIVQNVLPERARAEVEAHLNSPYSSLFVSLALEDFQIQVTKKGKVLFSSKKRTERIEPTLSHDRVISRHLPEGTPDRFLQAIGLMTLDGRIKADRQRKYQQINEFIRLVSETSDLKELNANPVLIIDFGCGNAYLSFALHHYLNSKVDVPCRLIGVDRNPELIARNNSLANDLGTESIEFVTSSIGDYCAPGPVDIVVALHACDTATDQALAQALQHKSNLIFSAPCCHHHLQVQLAHNHLDEAYLPIVRDGILRERLGDIITDSLRAMILRIAGYKVDVIEFISPEHTAKNLLIRAKRLPTQSTAQLIAEYKALKAAFGVSPHLESLVSPELRQLLIG